MEVVTGAMGSLLPKLGELLMKEYNLHKSAKKDIESLRREMQSMHAALLKVAEVPRDQLDGQLKLWADEVRELSYSMEDVVDKFLVRVDGYETPAAADNRNKLRRLMEKMGNLLRKAKARRQIANAIKDINKEVQEVANRRDRYTIENIMPNPASPRSRTTIDPRLRALYTEATELVGIYGKRDQNLIELLSLGDDHPSNMKLKITSVVGFGGLGKITLVRAAYDKIKGYFNCQAFVTVGRNPDVKKVFRNILIGLDKQKYTNINLTVLDEMQLIEELRDFLENKRYLVIIDDIWDEKTWNDIKLAFSNMNNLNSRLITTTCIVSVSKVCCPSTDDSIYQMKPLSDDDSMRLFHKRIFSSENECPSELEKVSRDILRKCGGVPLAIVTVASLLASDQQIKSKEEWHVLLKSIGRGLTKDASMEEMQRILSFSYYDLPSYLKTCLLYLSIYPEDHEIDRDELIWKWICENFVQHGKQDTNVFEIGESYFNELINRSMIQPVYNNFRQLQSCRVHDMVLDLICSLSGQANFVTILDGNKNIMCTQGNIRRLSLQNIKKDHKSTPLLVSMSQVRSITIFSSAMIILPATCSFDILRVLDLKGCDLRERSYQLNFQVIGYLFHLRYLGLKDTRICELPAQIGNLQFFQVLNVRGNGGLKVLPSSICKLRKLMIVNLPFECKWPPGVLGNLTSLEVLDCISASMSIMQELSNLARLRELVIHFLNWSLELEEAFVESICNMHNIQSLKIHHNCDIGSMDLLGERWVPPRHLRKFKFYPEYDNTALCIVPSWVNRCGPSHLSNLTELNFTVKEVHQEDVRMLGRLPALRYLSIWCTHQKERLLVIGADEFRCMISFSLCCEPAGQIVFQQGALPRVELVRFYLGLQMDKEDGSCDHFELGLGNLLSLQSAMVVIYWDEVIVWEAMEAEAAVRNVLKAHPNHPRIRVYMKPLGFKQMTLPENLRNLTG